MHLLCRFLLLAWLGAICARGQFSQPDAKLLPNVFRWTDTCNVYVLREGDAAILIDLGDGSVLEHLGKIGVKRVEWVLFTHHHREQCQGAPKLNRSVTRVAAPQAEAALFERPSDFRRMKVRLEDPYTIYGSSFVRPPIIPITLDRQFKNLDTFEWRGNEFWCVQTPGNSPGAMSYMLRVDERWVGFTGDVMLKAEKMHTWFDTEWDYGFGKGIWAICNSAAQIEGYDPALFMPSHGEPVKNAARELGNYQRKLMKLEKLYLRGYPVLRFDSAVQDSTSRPSKVPHVWQVSKHLFKLRGPNWFPNFYLILSDTGHGLVIDAGLIETNLLEAALQGIMVEYGLKKIDAVIPSHMHGDHFLLAPYLREKWGAEFWGTERMAPVCERPEDFDYAAPIQAYNIGVERVMFDRLFKEGEKLKWNEYEFTIDWMPGQTEFALCVQGKIDGKLVAFTGDNIFGDPRDPNQNGHEAMVAHNSAILEEGYIYAAEYLKKLNPDLLAGGHSYIMDKPRKFIERYRRWAYDMRDAFRELSPDPDYEYWFDPFWIRAHPYRTTLKRGEQTNIELHVRNFSQTTQKHQIEIHAPPGIVIEPEKLVGETKAEGKTSLFFKVGAESGARNGVNIVAIDITVDGKRYGELFDCIVAVDSN